METRSPRRFPARALRATAAVLALAVMAGVGAQTVSLNSGGKKIRIAVGGDATLPVDFPQDVALPASATLVRVQRGSGTTILEFSGTGAAGTVIDDLDARMRASGWQQAMVKAPASGQIRAWEKGLLAVIAWATPEQGSGPEDVVAAARTEQARANATGAASGTPATADTGAEAHRLRIEMHLVRRRGYPATP